MYKFTADFEIEKAVTDSEGRLFLEGVASTTNRDLQDDVISANAISKMANEAPGIPVTTSHNNEFLDRIGKVVDSHVQDGTKLFVKTELDATDPVARRAWDKVAKGEKAGFSIGGAIRSVKPGIGKTRRIIDDVALDHLMLTSKPANNDTFATALHKALESDTLLIDSYSEDDLADALLSKAVNVSAEQRKEHATYFEGNQGKFPIWNKASADSALHLIGHAPAEQQAKIKAKACKFSPDNPACKPDTANKTEDTMATTNLKNDKVEKVGAKFSADTMAKMKAIMGMDDPKAMKAAMGDLLEVEQMDAPSDEDSNQGDGDTGQSAGQVGDGDDSKPIGISPVSETPDSDDDSTSAGLKKAAEEMAELRKAIQKMLEAEAKGPEPTTQPEVKAPTTAELFKGLTKKEQGFLVLKALGYGSLVNDQGENVTFEGYGVEDILKNEAKRNNNTEVSK